MIHQDLTPEKWQAQSLWLQLANIGSEVHRAISWQERGNEAQKDAAVARGIELFNLTMSGNIGQARRREVGRAKEVFVDFLYGGNSYKTTAQSLNNYFLHYTLMAQKERGVV